MCHCGTGKLRPQNPKLLDFMLEAKKKIHVKTLHSPSRAQRVKTRVSWSNLTQYFAPVYAIFSATMGGKAKKEIVSEA